MRDRARSLFPLAYPLLSAPDKAVIDAFRLKHDRRRLRVVEPHFTMVFGIADGGDSDYIDHVAKIAAAAVPIRFHCRKAVPGAKMLRMFFSFPTRETDALTDLHGRLYSGLLAPRPQIVVNSRSRT